MRQSLDRFAASPLTKTADQQLKLKIIYKARSYMVKNGWQGLNSD